MAEMYRTSTGEASSTIGPLYSPPLEPLTFLNLYQTHQVLSHEDLLWLEKNFFFNSLPKLCYQNTKIKVKENKKLKNPLFITTIKVYILNIIQNISQGDTCMVGCACKRQTPHTPKDTDRWSAFSARNKPIPWM